MPIVDRLSIPRFEIKGKTVKLGYPLPDKLAGGI